MESLEDFPLQDYLGPIEIKQINGKLLKFSVDAYSVDKSSGNNGTKTLRNRLKMGSYHCCDYIFVTRDEIFLIEDSNLERKKKDLGEKYSYSAEGGESKEELINKLIKDEQVLKAYASLLILYRLSSLGDKSKILTKKKCNFLVIVNDLDITEEGEEPSDILFDNLKNKLDSCLRPLISESSVLNPGRAERKLKEYAGSA